MQMLFRSRDKWERTAKEQQARIAALEAEVAKVKAKAKRMEDLVAPTFFDAYQQGWYDRGDVLSAFAPNDAWEKYRDRLISGGEE